MIPVCIGLFLISIYIAYAFFFKRQQKHVSINKTHHERSTQVNIANAPTPKTNTDKEFDLVGALWNLFTLLIIVLFIYSLWSLGHSTNRKHEKSTRAESDEIKTSVRGVILQVNPSNGQLIIER